MVIKSNKIDQLLESLKVLFDFDYDQQTTRAKNALEIEWYQKYKESINKNNVEAAICILEDAIQKDAFNGLSWLKYGSLLRDAGDYSKALQSFLTGAKKCELIRISNLENAAEMMLLKMDDLENALSFFIKTILCISTESKGFGSEFMSQRAKLDMDQERAIQHLKIYLKYFNYADDFDKLDKLRLASYLDENYTNDCLSILKTKCKSDTKLKIQKIIASQFDGVLDHIIKLSPSYNKIVKEFGMTIKGDLSALKTFSEKLVKNGYFFDPSYNSKYDPISPGAEINAIVVLSHSFSGQQYYFGTYTKEDCENIIPRDLDRLNNLIFDDA